MGRTVATGYYFSYIVDGVTLDETDGPTRSNSVAVGYVDGESDGADTGTYAEVYVDDENQEVTVIIINTYLGQITDVDNDDPDEIVYTVDVFDDGELNTSLDITTDDDSFAEDDYVLVTAASEDDGGEYELQSIDAADTLNGAATTYATAYTEVDDVTYYHSVNYEYQDDYIASGDDFDSIYTFYQDSYGNIIGAELYSGSASSGNYLYLSDSYASYYSALYGEAYVAAAVTFVDGTEDVIYLRVTNSTSATGAYFYNPALESNYYIVSGTGESGDTTKDDGESYYDGYGDVIADGWYSYTVNSSGYYTLSELDTDVAGTATGVTTDDDTTAVKFDTDNNSSVDKTLYANSSTELVLVDSGLVYTGYTDFPSNSYGTLDSPAEYDVSVLYVTSGSGSSRLTNIYVIGTGSTTVDVTFAMFSGSDGRTSDGYYYEFYVDGVADSYLFDSSLSDIDEYDVGFLVEDTDGYYTFEEFDSATDKDDYYADESGYYVYKGVVTESESDYLVVWDDANDDGDIDDDETYNFALADDYEATRINSSESLTGSRAQEGDTVYVFSTKVSSGTAEAYAVFAVDEDLVSDTDEDEDSSSGDTVYGLYLNAFGTSRHGIYVDGTATTYRVDSEATGITFTTNTVYELTLNEDGEITSATALSNTTASTDGYYSTSGMSVESVVDNGDTLYTTASGNDRYLDASDATIYDTTGDGATTVAEGDTISVVRSSWNSDSGDYEATAYIIYITAHAETE